MPEERTTTLIRDATEADVPRILEIYNYEVEYSTCTADEHPLSLESRMAWFHERKRLELPVLVLEHGFRVVAWAALNPYSHKSGYRFTVENSVYVEPGSQGRGFGKMLLVETIRRARKRHVHSIIASLDGENAVSYQLHRSFGFEEVARYPELFLKFGRWLDVVHLQLLLEE
jgi:phosphinothricin acetyltransferase